MQPNPTLCPFQAAYNAPRQAPLCSAQAKAASSATTFKTTRSAPPAKANCDVSFPIRATFARAAAKPAYTKPYAATANAIRRPIPPFGRAPNTPPPSPPCCTHGNTTATATSPPCSHGCSKKIPRRGSPTKHSMPRSPCPSAANAACNAASTNATALPEPLHNATKSPFCRPIPCTARPSRRNPPFPPQSAPAISAMPFACAPTLRTVKL